MKSRRITAISLIIILSLIIASFVSCGGGLELTPQATIISKPINYKTQELLTPKYAINWEEKENQKKQLADIWKNMQYAPFTFYRQTGDVSTVTLGMTVVQSVLTIRLSERGKKEGQADNGSEGLEQSVNYLSSYSVTSKGIAGVDIRLMCESLRNKDGQYIYRQAIDASNIKLDPDTSQFYNLSGKWQEKKANNVAGYNNYSEDDPNNILGYDVKEETINLVDIQSNIDFTSPDFLDAQEYRRSREDSYKKLNEEIKNGTMPNVHVIEASFLPGAWEGKYMKNMYAMLELGGQSGTINYQGLDMVIEVWDNGFIRQIDYIESYDLDLGAIKAKASLVSNVQVSYLPKQEVVNPVTEQVETKIWKKEYLNKFGKQFSDKRKPPAGTDLSKLK